jgi:predicted RNA-binding Zn-ribbon protein involved in translation (DUF1610 family)
MSNEIEDNIAEAARKYPKDGEFKEPVLMCDSCAVVVLRTDVHRLGKCPECGNKRVRVCLQLNDANRLRVMKWQEDRVIDPLWIYLFEEDDPKEHGTINKTGLI